jgi:dTDP-4-amino-4,6-dideoxygalactose transaminase
MLGALVSQLRGLRNRFPGLYAFARNIGSRLFARRLGIYPRPLGREVKAVSRVIRSAKWNMAYGGILAHERLEADFAAYVGAGHAVAVNTGGMALQMSFRALGLKPGHEVILQADTCSATAFAVMNAGCTPLFADISRETFMLSPEALAGLAPGARAVIATHMWGNPEDMEMVSRVAEQNKLVVVEDACLALGAKLGDRMTGTSGHVGIFSFGCIKPIQGGEGGMIVTGDEALARELRSLRHWGDRTIDFGVRDTTQLAWNGRMSEIVAAVVTEQLRGYPAYLEALRYGVARLARDLNSIDGMDIVLGNARRLEDCSFTQVVVRLDEARLGCRKQALRDALAARGVPTWHANFEPIPGLSFFRNDSWREWILAGDIERAAANYHGGLPNAAHAFDSTGLGLPKSHLAPAMIGSLRDKIADAIIDASRVS